MVDTSPVDEVSAETVGWAASVTPSIGIELTPEQSLACMFRILADLEFNENLGGHITWIDRDDDTMLVNPWGLWWNELTASDICRVDFDANVVEGRWDVTPAIHIHTELHRVRPDAKVVVHNHPYWSTVLAALGMLPEFYHQTASMFDNEMVFVDEYGGNVENAMAGADLAAAIGDHRVALLANHGLIVATHNLADALYKSASFDRQCRLTYDVVTSGITPTTVAPRNRVDMKYALENRAADIYWAGAVRQLIARDPSVLD